MKEAVRNSASPAKKEKRLEKAGYFTKKGKFGAVKKGKTRRRRKSSKKGKSRRRRR